MQFKDITKSLLTLILTLVILFSLVSLIYTFLKVEVFNLGPSYINYYRCEQVDHDTNRAMSQMDQVECRKEVDLEAQKTNENEAKETYLYTIVMLIFATPLYFLNRKNLL